LGVVGSFYDARTSEVVLHVSAGSRRPEVVATAKANAAREGITLRLVELDAAGGDDGLRGGFPTTAG
jgi:hypothetical protein